MNDKEYEIVKTIARSLFKRFAISTYHGSLYAPDDLFSTGWQSVEKAHNKYGPNIDRSLLTTIIKHNMIDYIRTLTLFKRRQVPTSVASDVIEHDIKTVFYTNSPYLEAAQKDSFEALIRCLPPRERKIVKWYFEEGLTYKEIGKNLGNSESAVAHLFKKNIIPKLYESLTVQSS